MSLVFEGLMVPYPDFIAYNEIDYNCRIYRLVLDSTRRYVQKIACTGASFPKNTPIGQAFDYRFDRDRPFNHDNDQITINFQSDGYRYQDSMIVYDFNKVVEIFNPNMASALRADQLVKLNPNELAIFNNRGYPRINEDTMELEWYVYTSEYKALTAGYVRTMKSLNN